MDNIILTFIKEKGIIDYKFDSIDGLSECYMKILDLIDSHLICTYYRMIPFIDGPVEITPEKASQICEYICSLSLENDKITTGKTKGFWNIRVQEKMFIVSISNSGELCSVLQEALRLYNGNKSEDEINSIMKDYIEQERKDKEFIESLPYSIIYRCPIKKVCYGESIKSKRKCIYCGNTTESSASFKEIAHAIPESIGNKKFIQNEECDECNDYFAVNVEEHLSNMLMWERLVYGLKGKNGFPIFQIDNNTYARYIDVQERDFASSNLGDFEVARDLLIKENCQGPVIISSSMPLDTQGFDLSYIKGFSPVNVYKTLVKCAVGLIEKEELIYFSKTIEWLRYDKSYHKLPAIVIKTKKSISEEPELYIHTRKNEDYSLPYCYGELRILNKIFIFIIPFCDRDKCKFISKKSWLSFEEHLKNVYKAYVTESFSSTQIKKISIPFKKIRNINIDLLDK
ncbi:MAG: HNH endonuclease [Ruminococcus sp.]|nr:HNH endonuclease [Ruminococcus sp.]